MSSLVTRSLVIGATILGGIIAGFSLNRMLVELPAWQHLGAEAWARYTRAADLSRGFAVYPTEGLAALILTLGAASSLHFDPRVPRSAAWPLYLAAVTALLAFIVTRFLVAPNVLCLKKGIADVGLLQQALVKTTQWWFAKTILHILTFVCNIWALVLLASGRS